MTSKTFFQTMSDGTEICVNRWIPDAEPKAIIIISHGMSEHSMRYDKLASFLVDEGFLVSAHDHRGHGKTAQKQLENGSVGFGYLADKKGFEKVRDDIKSIALQLKTEFPDKKVFLLGHSFGSMVSQGFIEKYSSEIDGCILSGSRGPQRLLIKSALFVSDILYLLGQKKKTSKFLDHLAFGSYNKKIENKRTEFDWLTKDNMIVDMYNADQWCGFTMKTEFFHELFRMLNIIHKKVNMKKISNDLPVYIIAGTDDPVSNYGKTVQKLYEIYKSNGIKDVEIKLYENDRHELFNETDCEVVIKDTITWLLKHL